VRLVQLFEDWGGEQTVLNQVGTIRQNCQPYLQQNGGAIDHDALYRGVKPPGGHSVTGDGDADVIRKEVRLTDRRPSDTPRELHNFVNQYFQTHYGAPFRTAMFASGSQGQANDYGTVYVIFPAGEFQFLWSPDIEDMYSLTAEYGLEHHMEPGAQKEAFETLEDNVLRTYQTDNLVEAIGSNHEIMIRCSHYYGIHSDIMYNKELQHQIREGLYG